MMNYYLLSNTKQICRSFLFLCLVMTPVAVSAAEIYESVEKERPRLGVQVGAAFSNVSGPADINSSHRTGFAAGARLDIPLWSYFSIQPELTLVQRGTTLARAGGYNATAKFSTLQIPVLLKASLPNRTVSPYLTAGPVAFLNLSHSLDVNAQGGNVGTIAFEPRTLEFGLSMGGGIEVGPVFVAANYLVGLSQLDENSAQYQSKGIQLMGGVQF